MSNRLMSLVSFGTFGIAAILIVLVAYWTLWPYNVMEICNVRMIETKVQSGGYARIIVQYKKHMSIPARVVREIINDQVITLPVPDSNIPKASKEWLIAVKIPSGLHSGKEYRIHTTYSYDVNPLRTIHVSWTSPAFEIVNGDETVKAVDREAVQGY